VVCRGRGQSRRSIVCIVYEDVDVEGGGDAGRRDWIKDASCGALRGVRVEQRIRPILLVLEGILEIYVGS
jgi:hypothetical protein